MIDFDITLIGIGYKLVNYLKLIITKNEKDVSNYVCLFVGRRCLLAFIFDVSFDFPLLFSPTHLCSLCNCGERSLLGQGEMWHFMPSPGFDIFKMPEPKSLRASDDIDINNQSKGPQPTTCRRARGPMKWGR